MEQKVITSEITPRRKLDSFNITHITLSTLCLINSGFLAFKNDCPCFKFTNLALFFLSLGWIIYLIFTSVINFSNRGNRLMVKFGNLAYFFCHLFIFVLSNLFYFKSRSKCSGKWSFWIFIYIFFGYFVLFSVVSSILMKVIRAFNRKKINLTNPDNDRINHPFDYDVTAEDTSKFYY